MRELVTRDDGVTIDIVKANAEVYEENIKAQKVIQISDVYTQAMEYNSNGQIIYMGLAKPGSSKSSPCWQIRKYTWNGNVCTDIQFAEGNNKFDKIWDNRLSYTYS